MCQPVTVGPIALRETFTQVSWEKALGVFEARLACAPVERDTELRCWKEIVAKVYSEFVAKLPETDLATPTTGPRLKDTRVERSQSQSLLNAPSG